MLLRSTSVGAGQTSHKIMGHGRHTTITRGLSINTGGRGFAFIEEQLVSYQAIASVLMYKCALPWECMLRCRLDLLRNMYKFIVVFVGNQALWAE